jgi:hypothetical protein
MTIRALPSDLRPTLQQDHLQARVAFARRQKHFIAGCVEVVAGAMVVAAV